LSEVENGYLPEMNKSASPPRARQPKSPAPARSWKSSRPPKRIKWVPVVLALLVVNWVVASAIQGREPRRVTIPYTFFVEQVTKENVISISSRGATIQGTLDTKITYPPAAKTKKSSDPTPVTSAIFRTERPTFADDNLLEILRLHKVTVGAEPIDKPTSLWVQILSGFGPTLLLLGVMFYFVRKSAGAAGLGGLGQSKAELYVPPETPTTFADVAGIDEVVDDMREIVDFLQNPTRYQELGGMIPKGVLLTGPPGTGKTLLARALAGEAQVPFFSAAASEFIEMIVGVGASRVRDLFDKARAAAPSIIFLDELDAIGRARGGAMSFGGHDEREQTLNQILTEMDGFKGNEGVIVVAATNRPEILDAALLRPGRFDRHVSVNPPDVVGREAILRIHTRKVPLAADVNLRVLATITPGMVGADLRNLVNEAALLAARRKEKSVSDSDLTDALERVQLGAERHLVMTLEDRTQTAVHEAGHAIVAMLLPGADPVRKISIIPRGRALGVTFQSPDNDRYAMSEAYLRGRISGALGGRVAEQLKFGELSTGAESDLKVATAIARQMVSVWGMSKLIGPVSIDQNHEDQSPFERSPISEHTRETVDSEIRLLLDDCEKKARVILLENQERLDRLVDALLVSETLNEIEAYAIAEVSHGSPPVNTLHEVLR
jgi:cell division protease FtsH